MRNDDDEVLRDGDIDEALVFTALPREAPVVPGEFERLVHRLRREGFFPAPRRPGWAVPAAAAAAVVVFASGLAVGTFNARRDSLEDLLSRRDLSAVERVLLLQRAGSAYVRAAQGYADATANVDSSAVEVASRVLIGAAHAVARNSLDAGLSARLATALEPAATTPTTGARKPVIWY